MKIIDMPKLQSPFEREKINNKYVCVPKFRKEFLWILDKEKVIAHEKFDGTNVSIVIQEGNIISVMNRTNRINLWESGEWFYNGIKKAIIDKKIKPKMLLNGQYFGELLGEKLQGNPYGIKGHLWLPFDYIEKHYYFKFYYDWLEEMGLSENSTDEKLYNNFSNLFKVLKSIYFRQKDKEKYPEGIVFHNKSTGEMCKLRRDMFDWFEGKPHNWKE